MASVVELGENRLMPAVSAATGPIDRTKSPSIRPRQVEDSVKRIGFLPSATGQAAPARVRARLPTPSCNRSSWR